VLVAMSGGVDSSVAAALLVAAGHEVEGATMKLWGGRSDRGCCSVADVEDARRVAEQLGIVHHVFNFTERFAEAVVEPYTEAHAAGRTPNPCVACNRHLKFDVLAARATRLGFDELATGHHARIRRRNGAPRLARGADPAKDQSYVLSMLTAAHLERLQFPVGELAKAEVRAYAARLGLRTAAKPDSLDTCFIPTDAGRAGFLAERIPLHPARVVDAETGEALGETPAVELVTVGQRRGLGVERAAAARRGSTGRVGSGSPGLGSGAGSRGPASPGGSSPPAVPSPAVPSPGVPQVGRRYVVDVDVARRVVRVGPAAALAVTELTLEEPSWVGEAASVGAVLEAQGSAHGTPFPVQVAGVGDLVHLVARQPVRRVAPGQTVALYAGDEVVGSGTAA
jgi:tRNA-specific 2-thiouridylase